MTRQNHNNRLLKRNSAHWQRVSRIARQHHPWCNKCGTTTDLTGDYEGDHSKARWQDITVLCRTCHSHKDGGRPQRFFHTPINDHVPSRRIPPRTRFRASRAW